MIHRTHCLGLVSAALALVLIGCGDDDASCPLVDGGTGSVQALVGPTGGTLELTGGGKLEVPPGALDEEVMITITELDEPKPLPLGLDSAGKAIAFEPHGTVFNLPVTLTVPIKETETDLAQVRAMKLDDDDDDSWTTILDGEKSPGKITLETTSFSIYMAARPRRNSGVVVLPDGAVVLPMSDASVVVDAGSDSAVIADAGVDASTDASVGVDAAVDATVDAAVDPVCDPLTEQCPVGEMTQLVVGYGHACALYEAGIVYCWGENGYGETGQGDQNAMRSPGIVQFYTGVNLTDVTSISTYSAGRHVCGTRSDGSVVCWGDNANGKAGSTAPSRALRAYPVPGVSGAVSVSAGVEHTCAVLNTGRVLCWGINASGELGTGDTLTVASSAATPMLQVEPQSGGNIEITDAVEVIAGRNLTCVLHSNRQQVSCTGRNQTGGGHLGMLGRGLTGAQYTSAGPALLPAAFTVRSMVVGNTLYGSPVCLVSSDGGAPLCWGYNSGYMLAGASVLIVATPTRLDPYYAMPQRVAMGADFLCVSYVHPNFGPRVACQGYDSHGQLGRGTVVGSSVSVPDDVVTTTNPVAYLDGASIEFMGAGAEFVCAKLTSGGVTCWGSNRGQIRGDTGGNRPYVVLDEPIPGLPSP